MKIRFFAALLGSLFFCTSGFSETVTTSDGRIVQLNEDGTYEFVTEQANDAVDIEVLDPFFTHHSGEYGRNSVRFMPIFRNNEDQAVVGLRFTTEFRSAFGDELFTFSGESGERIPAGRRSTSSVFYFFEDNQFMSNEPYDILQVFLSSGTGTVTTHVTAVVLENGEVVSLVQD